ncbi:hypothetical protein SANTM175S_00651 [Streptomyces antimycoticus]
MICRLVAWSTMPVWAPGGVTVTPSAIRVPTLTPAQAFATALYCALPSPKSSPAAHSVASRAPA